MTCSPRATAKVGSTKVIVVAVKKPPAIALRVEKRRRYTRIGTSLARKKQAIKIGIKTKAAGLANNSRKFSFTPVMIKKIGIKKP